ncbi:Smr/MutS family protein [Sphingomonas sp.]|uniref:Smr/MutS family protein n=1 Tax=Sphingomonas sp. TaxID=28214 RepID=UPI003340F118
MGTRPLSPDEAALWARVMAGVRPLQAKRAPVAGASRGVPPKPLVSSTVETPFRPGASPATPATSPDAASRLRSKRTDARAAPSAPANTPSNTLDGTWDRQLSRGLVSPDRTIDLHGHTLHSAHDLLDAALDAAIRHGNRLILLITGKPPRPTSERPHARGAIRAATGDWLAGSRHAAAIAAVRAAHPRHGGAGALYIVLRKPRVPAALSRKS